MIEIIGWIATVFRGAGMLCKSANMVKYLVSVGNLFWMINGLLTHNTPLVVSNAFCLAVILFEIAIKYYKNKLEKYERETETTDDGDRADDL